MEDCWKQSWLQHAKNKHWKKPLLHFFHHQSPHKNDEHKKEKRKEFLAGTKKLYSARHMK